MWLSWRSWASAGVVVLILNPTDHQVIIMQNAHGVLQDSMEHQILYRLMAKGPLVLSKPRARPTLGTQLSLLLR